MIYGCWASSLDSGWLPTWLMRIYRPTRLTTAWTPRCEPGGPSGRCVPVSRAACPLKNGPVTSPTGSPQGVRQIELALGASTAAKAGVVPPATQTFTALHPDHVDLGEEKVEMCVVITVRAGYPRSASNVCLRVEPLHWDHSMTSAITPCATSRS